MPVTDLAMLYLISLVSLALVRRSLFIQSNPVDSELKESLLDRDKGTASEVRRRKIFEGLSELTDQLRAQPKRSLGEDDATAVMNMMKDRQNTLDTLIMPVSIPQVAAPRITVQNFNSPVLPIQPGVLKSATVDADILMPSRTDLDDRIIEVEEQFIEEGMGLAPEEQLGKAIERAFTNVLRREHNLVQSRGDRTVIKTLYESTLLRETLKVLMQERLDESVRKMTQRLSSLQSDLEMFAKEVDSRLNTIIDLSQLDPTTLQVQE